MLANIAATGYSRHARRATGTASHGRTGQPAISPTCEHIDAGHGAHARCDLRHRTDITHWCFPCLRNYILDRRAHAGDCRAGDFDGHPESLEVIGDAMLDLTPFGPAWYYERDDRAASGGLDVLDAAEPTDDELDRLARGWAPEDAWELEDEAAAMAAEREMMAWVEVDG